MPEIDVFVGVEAVPAGGFVAGTGATQSADHVKVRDLAGKVIKVSSETIADTVASIASAVGPTLKKKFESLPGLQVQEVSLGCTIGANGSIVVAGMGVEASLVITFKVT